MEKIRNAFDNSRRIDAEMKTSIKHIVRNTGYSQLVFELLHDVEKEIVHIRLVVELSFDGVQIA